MSRVRPIAMDGPLARIALTRGYVAVIDAEDVPLVEGRNWSALVSARRRAVYAVRVEHRDGKQTMVLMHRVIAGAAPGEHVDHINGDGLDNRKANVRCCSQAENNRNTPVRRDNASGLKGVCLDKRVNRWKAEIQCNGKRRFLGYFPTAQEAHNAYQAASTELFGQFSRPA